MRRAVIALAVLALTTATVSAGTFADYTQTRSNSASVSTSSSFLPVSLSAPSISGTVALLQTLTLTPGTWGYSHGGDSLGISGEQSITQAEQWQYCLSGTCHDIAGATGSTLSLTSTLLTSLGLPNLIGVTFRVSESASNASGSATSVLSNVL